MLAFARVSPIAPLLRLAQPVAAEIGLVIALAEIAVGLGALSGLAFRLAAWIGALLSIVFFLTASWTTRKGRILLRRLGEIPDGTMQVGLSPGVIEVAAFLV